MGYLGSTNGVQNDIVAAFGYTYEAWRDSDGSIKVNQRQVNTQSVLNTFNLGGYTAERPAIGAIRNNDGTVSALAVFVRATDGSIDYQVSPSGSSFGSYDAGGTFVAGRWGALGGITYGNPSAYGGRGFVGVAVQGNAGAQGSRYWNYTGDGRSFLGYTQDRPGVEIGTNLNGDSGDLATINSYTKADVSRLRMFFNNDPVIATGVTSGSSTSSGPKLNVGVLDNLIANGAQTIIVTGNDAGVDWEAVKFHLTTPFLNSSVNLLQYAQAHGNTMFYYEMGNEPDRNYYVWGQRAGFDAYSMRAKALDSLNHYNRDAGYRDTHSNLRLMISMPTHNPNTAYADIFAGRPATNGATNYRSLNSWDDTYNEGGSTDGNVYIGKAFDAMAVHTYCFSCFDMANTSPGGEAPNELWQDIIAYYAQRGSGVIYLTEAAVNDSSYSTDKWVNYMAARYVMSTFGFDAANSPFAINGSGGQANGRVKGVTFFQTNYGDAYTYGHLAWDTANGGSGNPYYNIDEGASNQYGGHQKIGNRDTTNSGCGR
ncbi:MAG: hypothetical protein ACTHMU_16055 [Thermomicrobiales bacterium]